MGGPDRVDRSLQTRARAKPARTECRRRERRLGSEVEGPLPITRPEDMGRRLAVTLRRLLKLEVPAVREKRLDAGEFVIARAG